jgi:hypothetical protein
MKKNKLNFKFSVLTATIFQFALLLSIFLLSCNANDDFKDNTRSLKPDSITVYGGINRLQLVWKNSADAARVAVVTGDSAIYLKPADFGENIILNYSGLAEGTYSFEVRNLNQEGYSSKIVAASGVAYGENYIAALEERTFESANISEGKGTIVWNPFDQTDLIRTEIRYTAAGSASETTVWVQPDDTETLFSAMDLSKNSFSMRSVFCPALGMDTIYLDWQNYTFSDNSFRDNCTYFVLNTHTVGNGVTIVMVGDGFSRDDNKIGGYYEQVCRDLTDVLFKCPIVKDFKEYFDVYAVVAESASSGINAGNIFKSGAGGADFSAANAFTCQAVPGLAGILSRAWIFIGNGMIGGFANFGVNGNCGSGVYSTAEGVSLYWMTHEFVGHAFASLADEYGAVFGEGYYGGAASLREMQRSDMGLNCSTTASLTAVPWKRFIGLEGYEEVGVYEGGWGNDHNIWKPEKWSIMVGNDQGNGYSGMYFNAQSRWLVYKRIRTIAELLTPAQMNANQKITTEQEDALFADFLEYDKEYNVK